MEELTDFSIRVHLMKQNQELNGAEFKVYVFLFLEALAKEYETVHASYSNIETGCKLSRPTVAKTIRNLEKKEQVAVKSESTYKGQYTIHFLARYWKE